MATYAGRYDEVAFRATGGFLKNVDVPVYNAGTTTLATLYSSRSKTLAAANPVSTDAYGNLVFFAEPGSYDLVKNGVTHRVDVRPDPAEPGSGGISDGSVGTAGLVDDAVTSAKIAAGAVGTTELADDAVTGAKIADGAVTAGHLSQTYITDTDARLSNSRPPTAHASSHAPGASDDLSGTYATRVYADAISAGLDPKDSVRVATTANVNLSSAPAAIDGVTLTSGDRVLVKNQSSGAQNGLYVFNGAASAMTRSTDADTSGEVTGGLYTLVTEGTQAATGWVLTTTGAITLGTTALTFTQFSAAATVADGGVSTAKLADGAVTAGKLATDAVTTAKVINAAVTADKLATDSVTTAKIAAGAVTAAKVANDVTTQAELDAHAADTSLHGAGSSGTVADGGVTTAKLADGAVTTAKLATGAVGETELSSTIKDPGPAVPGARTLGTGAQQAASGTDSRLSNARTPTAHAASHAPGAADDLSGTYATRAYADAISQGLDIKESARAATTANITLSGAQTIDGVSVIATNRVLVKNQTTAADNGIYVAAAGAWARSTDADTSGEVDAGMFVFVEEGTVNGDTGWVLTTNGPIGMGSTALTFTQFSGATVTAGTGLDKTGNTLSIAAGGVTATQIAAALKGGPADGTEALRALGTSAGQALPGDHASVTNTRTPTDASVTTAKLAAGAVTAAKVAADVATQAELDAHAADTNLHGGGGALADGAVTTAKIADGAVTTAKFAVDMATQAELNSHAQNLTLHGAAAAGDNIVNTVYNVKDAAYGAVGNGSTDDTAAIQAAIDACNANFGGIVYFPRGTYKITSTITWKRTVMLQGSMGIGNTSNTVPNITWWGPAGGTMIDTDVIGGNRPWAALRRLVLNGQPTGQTGVGVGAPAIGLRFRDRVDLGSGLVDAQIMRINGNGIQFDQGGINFEFRSCRFDSIRDWGVYWVNANTSDRVVFEQFTYDNQQSGSDPTNVPGGGGLVHFYGAAQGNNAQIHVSMRSAKLEVNKTLNGSTHGAGVDATIKFTCNPFMTGNKQTIEGLFDDVWVQGGGGVTISDASNPTIRVTPVNNFAAFDIRRSRGFPIVGVPGYNNLLTGSSRFIAHAIVQAVSPRVQTSPSQTESSAIELKGLANISDIAIHGKYATPIIGSTGADWTEPVTLYKGWILEPPTNLQTPGSTRWLQVMANCTVGTALSGVTATGVSASVATLSDATNVQVGHWITVDGASYEVVAKTPQNSQIQVFPNFAVAPSASAVTYTPLTTRELFTYTGATTAPAGTHGHAGQIVTNTADTGASGQVIFWKRTNASTWVATTRP